MTDRYTRFVLSIIAAALVTLTALQLTGPADAVGDDCSQARPCFVVAMAWNDFRREWEVCSTISKPCFDVHLSR